jgi:hypothetical protein
MTVAPLTKLPSDARSESDSVGKRFIKGGRVLSIASGRAGAVRHGTLQCTMPMAHIVDGPLP